MIIGFLLSINILLGAFMYWKMTWNGTNTNKVTTKAVTFIPEMKNAIAMNGNKVIIQGTTNLPDGTNVKYNLWHMDKLSAKNNIEKYNAPIV